MWTFLVVMLDIALSSRSVHLRRDRSIRSFFLVWPPLPGQIRRQYELSPLVWGLSQKLTNRRLVGRSIGRKVLPPHTLTSLRGAKAHNRSCQGTNRSFQLPRGRPRPANTQRASGPSGLSQRSSMQKCSGLASSSVKRSWGRERPFARPRRTIPSSWCRSA
jgi:hypothetical protein